MTARLRFLVAIGAACASVAATLVAQAPVFVSRREVVRLDVLVSDRGRPVLGLTAADFKVLDNGVPQQVEFVGFDEVPLNVVLTFDASGSLEGQRFQELQAAGHAVLDELRKDDRAALVSFSEIVSIGPELTGDVPRLRTMLGQSWTGGQTSLVDAAFAGLVIGTSDMGRSLLLVFSDGVDTASWLTAASALDAAKRGDVVVIGVSAGRVRNPFLKDLADATGGDLVEIRSTSDLRKTLVRLLTEHRQRYLVAYSPSGVASGGWHKVDVSVAKRGATITTRPGYQRR
jgi:VWFA-related protein